MAESAYTFRKQLFDVETTCIVRDDELVVRRSKEGDTSIPLSKVRSIRLRDDGLVNGVHMYACVVRTDHRQLEIRSCHCAGLGKCESRGPEYRRFVLALQKALRPRAESVQFLTGSRLAHTTALIFVIVIPLLMLAAGTALILSRGGACPPVWRVLALATMFPAMARMVRKGRPAVFDPSTIPEPYLP